MSAVVIPSTIQSGYPSQLSSSREESSTANFNRLLPLKSQASTNFRGSLAHNVATTATGVSEQHSELTMRAKTRLPESDP